MKCVLLFSIAVVVSFGLGIPIRSMLGRLRVLDLPNGRSSHQRPTVRGGGIGIVLSILGIGAIAALKQSSDSAMIWLLLVLALAMVSFWDDFRTLSWKIRFGMHAMAALVFLYGLVKQGDVGGASVSVAAFLFLLLILVGYTNAFNFMDGVNGMAASQAAITGLGTIAICAAAGVSLSHPAVFLAAIIAGAAAGFLPHNFPNAKMFMGDVGSVPVGFGLASVAVWLAADHGWWLLVPLGSLHANFVLDTSITIIRRVFRREAFHQAHREHFYQRWVRIGKSHTAVTMTEMGLQVIVLALLIWYFEVGVTGRAVLIAIVLAIWLMFFGWVEIRCRRFLAEGGRFV